MANKYAGEVEVNLGDGRHVLRYTWNAWASFQSASGKPWIHYLGRFKELGSIAPEDTGLKVMEIIGPMEMRALIWAGLLEDNPRITLEEVGRLLEGAEGEGMEAKFLYLFLKVMEAWSLSLPEAQKKKVPADARLGGPEWSASDWFQLRVLGAEYGIHPREFWHMTPSDFYAQIRGRERALREEKVTQANGVIAAEFAARMKRLDGRRIHKLLVPRENDDLDLRPFQALIAESRARARKRRAS